jgi:NitT/TauT family transport system substrate-binding protein
MKTKQNRVIKIIISLICITTLFILPGCAKKDTSSAPSPSTKSFSAKVGTWKTAQTIQPFLYQKYVPNKSTVKVLPFTNPGDQKTALLAGNLDMCGTTLATAITAASQGEPVVVVSSLCNKCSALVVGKDSDIKTPADLKGKTIAYVPGTMHHILLLEVLQRAGLDPNKDVTLKRIDFFDMGQALAQGSIDAFCSGEPYPSIAVAKGYGRILSYPYFNESIGPINASMLTTRDEIKNNRELIQQLVTAHVKATEYLKSHPDEWLNQAAGFGTERAVLDTAANNIELAWNMDSQYIKQATALAQQMKKLGVITNIPDMNKLFDTSFVKQAKKDLEK